MKKYSVFLCCAALSLFMAFGLKAQAAGNNYALLIAGLGGEQQYTVKFQRLLLEAHKAFIEQFQFNPENITVLAEKRSDEDDFINDISTAENIREEFDYLASRVTENDHVFIILFGHGSYDGTNAKINIPRKDLSDADFSELIGKVNAGRIIFINTTSSSFPFVKHLSASSRIVIVATKSPTQRNITSFPDFLVEGFSDPSADFDRNGNLSIQEIFRYAAEKTDRFYSDQNHLATEHAMMDDNGDGLASRVNELEMNGEGALAGVTYLKRRMAIVTAGGSAPGDSTLLRILAEQEKTELAIAHLKNSKSLYSEDEYFVILEELLIKLARLSDELEKYEKIR